VPPVNRQDALKDDAMQIARNPYRGPGIDSAAEFTADAVATDPAPVLTLLARCPAHGATPLRAVPALAARCGAGSFFVKDESSRMGLGSFKALGAAYAIARDAVAARPNEPEGALAGRTYVTASAGNHGMSVAAGAHIFGADAVIYIADTVSEAIAERLGGKGAKVIREGADYEASMAAAEEAARANGWILISDSSWPGYSAPTRHVMHGYLAMGVEIADAMERAPSHIVLQAGVGGFAASLSAYFRSRWGDAPTIVIAEPDFAPCLARSIAAGGPVRADGPVSSMGRLDCKEPSHLALAGLARDADWFATIGEEEVAQTVALLGKLGLSTTPSGAAGIAAALRLDAEILEITEQSRILAFMTEAG
jgi:diaminopropionate ammonia-lyase